MPGNPSSPSAMPFGASPTSFVVDFDLAGLLAGLGIDCGTADDQEAVFAAEQEALAASPEPPVEVPGRVAALLPTGAGLAAWLESATSIEQCSDVELPDLALGYRRLAAWAQAQELSALPRSPRARRSAATAPVMGAGQTRCCPKQEPRLRWR
jgi:hypothetical protein